LLGIGGRNVATLLQLCRNVTCKWCGCQFDGDHQTIEECVQALELEVSERRQALSSRRPRRDSARDSTSTRPPRPPGGPPKTQKD
jgi:hypothetical protein